MIIRILNHLHPGVIFTDEFIKVKIPDLRGGPTTHDGGTTTQGGQGTSQQAGEFIASIQPSNVCAKQCGRL